MLDSLLSLTSLPNLHPALVHFPIALLPAALALDLVVRWTGGRPDLDRVAAGVWVAGALSAWIALEAGEAAAETLLHLTPRAEAALAEHSDLGHWAFWLFALLAAVRATLTLRERGRSRVVFGALRWGLVAAAVAALVLMAVAADHGGALVYGHGIGVAPAVLGSP